jgi:SAM-dependent methyltransferase
VATISKSSARFGALRRQFAIKVEQVGVRRAFGLAALKLLRKPVGILLPGGHEVHPFDRKHGTETSAIVELGSLDIPDQRLRHAVRYQTAIVDVFLAMLDALPIEHKDFAFIDLGAGKGRALLLASRFPFSNVIGVELSPTLHEIARRNIALYGGDSPRCHQVRSVCADAASFELPLENLVIYLFNPFDEVVMSEVAANVSASLKKKPRQIYILYLKPDHRGVWEKLTSLTTFRETADYIIYRTA